jgi:radical SAM protein with 4Fe4S-binding SPASM domain
MGIQKVTLIGGEILLINNWDVIARKFVDAGVDVNIITNAYKLDDDAIKIIQKSKISSVAISVDGMSEVHNNIRGKHDAFAKALNGFSLLRAANIPFSVITTIVAANFPDLDALYNLVSEQGAFTWKIQLASPMGNARQQTDFLINPKQIPALVEFIRVKNQLGGISIRTGDNLCFREKNHAVEDSYYADGHGDWYGCMAGLFVVGIDSSGNVRGCESLCADEFIEGNLRTESLATIWHKDGAFAYNRGFKPEMLKGKCSGCDQSIYCAGGCRQLSYFTSGCCHESIFCNYQDMVSSPCNRQ